MLNKCSESSLNAPNVPKRSERSLHAPNVPQTLRMLPKSSECSQNAPDVPLTLRNSPESHLHLQADAREVCQELGVARLLAHDGRLYKPVVLEPQQLHPAAHLLNHL
jgi:hypothetical protein